MVGYWSRPGKVCLTDDELSIYEIAHNLGKFVWEVMELPYVELLGWYDYFSKRPSGWREDDRAAKIIQSAGVKEKPWKLFPSLDAIYNKNKKQTDNPTDTLAGSMFMQMILGAQGGHKLDP